MVRSVAFFRSHWGWFWQGSPAGDPFDHDVENVRNFCFDEAGNIIVLGQKYSRGPHHLYKIWGQRLFLDDSQRYRLNRETLTVSDRATGDVTQFNSQGQPIRFTDIHGNRWDYEWNGEDDLTTITDPKGGLTQLTYSPDGKLRAVADPTGRTTQFDVDASGDLVR
ncbi:MAG TPA: hypothetical protein PK395_21710, partial [bacterium]|nr:hypothetical protein [bacterium]